MKIKIWVGGSFKPVGVTSNRFQITGEVASNRYQITGGQLETGGSLKPLHRDTAMKFFRKYILFVTTLLLWIFKYCRLNRWYYNNTIKQVVPSIISHLSGNVICSFGNRALFTRQNLSENHIVPDICWLAELIRKSNQTDPT